MPPSTLPDVPDPSPRRSSRPGDTRARILDAAERLFAERGFEGASMRALARAASASLSSTNYHFGTKEALVEAVLRRRAEPLNAIRLERLDEAERLAEADAVSIERILDAFVRPLVEMRAANDARRAEPGWLAARLFSDPAPFIVRMRAELFREVDERFLAALARALPRSDRREIEIAYQLTNGLLIHFASGRLKLDDANANSQTEQEETPLLRALLDFAGAGLHQLERKARPA